MSEYLLRPASLPTWSQRAALRVLHLFGWKLRFKPLPGPHGIAVVYPHTSNWDFIVGLVGKWAVGVPFRWLAKESLFHGPLGAMMRYWGGMPVERREVPAGSTRRLADRINASDWMWVAITPEGARAHRPHWKSGFYHLALAAKVPLVLVALDFGKKEIRVTDELRLTGDLDADMAAIRASYAGVTALYPDQAAPIMLAAPARGRRAGAAPCLTATPNRATLLPFSKPPATQPARKAWRRSARQVSNQGQPDPRLAR